MSTLHVVFKVASAEYLLNAAEVLHIDAFEGATPVPGAPPWVAGLVQVRRRVVPVVDLRARFGLPPLAPSIQSRVIVVQDGERQVGLAVDSSREVLHLAADQFKEPPEIVQERAQRFVKAVAQKDQRLLMLIDVQRVVGPEDVLATDQEEATHGGE